MDEGDGVTRREGRAPLHRSIPDLDRGSLVGRYVILDVVGQGGMGVVYAAYDPQLERKVAIKLLQAGDKAVGSLPGSQAWLQREAQAQAKLAHPNVLPVFDVGTLADDRLFVAMELVDGETLRAWLDAEQRTWREIVATIAAAGAGLAAAHRVGLVHRDFKPENVLVGRDGRARVMDFGLAHERDDATLRSSGGTIGTPLYIAPELYAGEPANAASDQFALGITLYTALFGGKPYEKTAFVKSEGEPHSPPAAKPPPAGTAVPSKIQRAVMRAIAVDARERWPSVEALLRELDVEPAARRRRAIAVGLAFACIAAVGAFAVGHHHTVRTDHARPEPCTGTEARLAGVWDARVREAVQAVFLRTKLPYAEHAFEAVAAGLDRYTGDWLDATVGSCRATRVTGEQPEAVQALRQGCLDARLEVVRDLTKLLSDPDTDAVDKSDRAVAELEPVRGCADVQTLTVAAPGSAAGSDYTAMIDQIQMVRAQLSLGNVLSAVAAAQQIMKEAREHKLDGIAADAALLRGSALLAAGLIDQGLAALEQAAWAGLGARRLDVLAPAAIEVASVLVDQKSDPDAAQVWIDMSAAASAHSPYVDDWVKGQRLAVLGAAQAARGDFDAAIKTHQQALAAAKQQFGAEGGQLWQAESDLAATLSRAGAWPAAIPHLEHALALRERDVGPDFPDIALLASNLGACYDHVGEHAKASAMFDHALAIRERTFGKQSPYLVATLNNMADHERKAGNIAGALAYIARAKDIAKITPGTASPLYHIVLTTEAETFTAAGDAARARAAFDAVLALEHASHSSTLPTTLVSRGELELAQKAWTNAATFEQQAIAALEATGGKDALDLWKPLFGLATAQRALDPKAHVQPLLERALELAQKAKLADAELAPIRAALARAP